MRILSGIFKSRDKPQNTTSGSAYRFFQGGSTSGKMVTERSAINEKEEQKETTVTDEVTKLYRVRVSIKNLNIRNRILRYQFDTLKNCGRAL